MPATRTILPTTYVQRGNRTTRDAIAARAAAERPHVSTRINAELHARGWDADRLAAASGIKPHVVHQLLTRRRPRAGVAVAAKLARVFGGDARDWMHKEGIIYGKGRPRGPETRSTQQTAH